MLRRVGAQLLQGIVRPASAGQQTFTRGLQFYEAPNGPAVTQTPIEEEWYNRQRNLLPVLDKVPWIQQDTWIAPNAIVAGDVDIYDKVGIFFGAVVRGDLNKIRIGGYSVVLDRAVIHAAKRVPTGLNAATIIGDYVTIEPYSVLRSCRVEPKVLIGARSVICEGAIIESESILTPGSVVPPARRIPAGELWGGNPVKFIRKLTGHEKDRVITDAAEHYINMAQMFRSEELPHGTQWREVEAYREKLVASQEYQWVNFREQKYLMRVQAEAEAMAKLTQ
uniref:Gamma carbonic anhydrase n=1 Tax=Chlamydomonas leiostraca TaxID=1034604 RepID=A0A7S0R823_9CHLO|mmetsp:Transcript_15516/g.38635  ORF Transcript_15516/g.38635 Transcript_15516/m.38635 type:complete len:279 (+) Transcript_15516:47-883(+)